MSLREEIWRQLRINEYKGEFFPDAADKIINKVLDAVVNECYQWFKQAETEELSFDDLIARIEAINKLRGD